MEDCPYLRRRAADTVYCEAAINFSLEAAKPQDLCIFCEVLPLSLAEHCRHLELYGYLRVDQDHHACWRVGVTRACGLDTRIVDAGDCQACTRYEAQDAPWLS